MRPRTLPGVAGPFRICHAVPGVLALVAVQQGARAPEPGDDDMKPTIFAVATAATMLAACSDGNADTDGDGTVSTEELAAASQGMVKPQPGQYETTMEFVDMEIPGMNAEETEMMKSMMAGASGQSFSYCLTEEEAARGFEKMARMSENDDCEVAQFNASGGDLSASMTCAMNGTDAQIEMTGSGTETSSDMTMKMVTRSPEIPGGEMRMTMRMKSQRTGDCA